MTFPVLEKVKFFRLVLFNFLTGNEDAHLKNYSVITRSEKQELSPCYDLVNSTLALGQKAVEESALPVNGKKSNLTVKDLIEYFGKERLKLTEKIIGNTKYELQIAVRDWKRIIEKCFLPPEMKSIYINIVQKRVDRLFGG